jgi:hypothetical protein
MFKVFSFYELMEVALLLLWICLVKLTTSDKFCIAFSSILPTELYIKQELKSTANEKMRESWA